MSQDPLLDRIKELRGRLVMTAGLEYRNLSIELARAESQLVDRELAAYLAGEESPPAPAYPETPLTSAAVLAEIISLRGTDPLPPVNPARPRQFVPGGEYHP